MSWQATAWAEKRKTGSPSRKVLLLVLANYANEQGYCWPSQETLSKGTEQSVDTIQRQIKRLAADGHLTIERKPRSTGRWPSLAYRLHMFTEPQDAARSEVPVGGRPPATCGPAEPQPARITEPQPTRITEPQALRHELSNLNIQSEPSSEPPPPSSTQNSEPRTRQPRKSVERTQSIQNRVVERLGGGDVAQGWLLFGALDGLDRKYLEDCERWAAPPNDALLDEYRRAAARRMRTSAA